MTDFDTRLAVTDRDPMSLSTRINHVTPGLSEAAFPTATTTIADLFPSTDTAPADYKLRLIDEGCTRFCCLPWDNDKHINLEEGLALYIPEGRQEGVDEYIACRILLADEDRRSLDELNECHNFELWELFGGQPTVEVFTDWVKTDLTEQRINSHQRTEHWRRVPVLYNEPTRPDTENDLPCSEFASTVQTTDWGVIHVGAHIGLASAEGRSRRIRDDVFNQLYDRVNGLPTPELLTDALDHTEWADLTTADQQNAIAAVAARSRDYDPEVADIIEDLQRRYGTLSADIEQLVETELDVNHER